MDLDSAMDEVLGELSVSPVPRTRGRAPVPIEIAGSRELTSEDIASRGTESGIKTSPIRRISQRHHTLAKLIADGNSNADAAIMSGYSPNYVSILRSDPSFSELVVHYSKGAEENYYDHHKGLAELAEVATGVMLDRLEQNPDSVSNAVVADLIAKGSDRIGFGPQSKTTKDVNVHVGVASRLDKARERAIAAKTIEHEITSEVHHIPDDPIDEIDPDSHDLLPIGESHLEAAE